ncbi:hypothetical protein [Nocardia macrotermitis]|uniref:Uncharacterized protein n=1 Tax=Nocardia macrotermitis TaxID=2585198 RepID=A0A7K0D2X2_9NOCA|nr:hypothetical protein [Nocardia macrotermitis]MQY20065.1 hypothetical protein [Nocardia macrotermitis]
MSPSRIAVRVLLTLSAIVWTIAAAYSVAIGVFAAADTRCGTTTARVDMTGGWWVIATVTVWALPFVIWALRTRTRLSVSVAVVTMVTGIVIVAWLFTHPTRFCW